MPGKEDLIYCNFFRCQGVEISDDGIPDVYPEDEGRYWCSLVGCQGIEIGSSEEKET